MAAESDILNAGILIVDDLEFNVRVLDRILRNAGYHAIASTTDPRKVCPRDHTTHVTLKGAGTAPGSLELQPHALAPVADLPVRKVESALHFVVDLTLDLGDVVYDHLSP